jgi:hypothetical protein
VKRPSLTFGGLTMFRAVLVAVGVVVGLVVMAKAFPIGASRNVVGAPPAASPTPRPSPSPSPTSTRSPLVKGLHVQILNGTTKTGLAASETQQLASAGYSMKPPGDAATTTKTTVYYASTSRPDAEHLRDTYFPGGRVKAAPTTFPRDVDVTVVLGEDFVTSPTPSP